MYNKQGGRPKCLKNIIQIYKVITWEGLCQLIAAFVKRNRVGGL